MGLLYYVSGAFLVLSAVAILVPTLSEGRWQAFVLIALCLGMGVLSIVVGRGIRTLQPWARTICIVLAVIGLLAFPVGTMINAYILYLLHAEKGKRIFKEDYAAIMAATPGVKYRTSPVVWIVLGIILLVVAAAIVVPILSS